jgi:nucleotide-binding universal stress UspA family protein
MDLREAKKYCLTSKKWPDVFQVIDPASDISRAGLLVTLADQIDALEKKVNSYLNGVRARLLEKNIETHTRVVSGIPLEVICQTAEKENVDLIALASHGRTGAARFFYGSVATGVLNRVDRPLLMIRSKPNE